MQDQYKLQPNTSKIALNAIDKKENKKRQKGVF